MQTLQLRWIKEKKKKRKKGEERIEKGKNFREKCYDRGGEKYKEGRKEGRKGERFRYPLVGNSDNASAHLSSRWILDGPASLFPLLPGLERRGTRSIGNPSPGTRRRKHRSRARPQCIFTYEGSVKAFTLPTDISRRSQTTSRAPPLPPLSLSSFSEQRCRPNWGWPFRVSRPDFNPWDNASRTTTQFLAPRWLQGQSRSYLIPLEFVRESNKSLSRNRWLTLGYSPSIIRISFFSTLYKKSFLLRKVKGSPTPP